MLDNQPGVEGWHKFPHERDEFLGWLTKARIEGVMFLSGDRHMTKLIRRSRAGGYPLYELTCSPLTSSPRDPEKEHPDPEVMEGMVVGSRNFCTLFFSGPHGGRKVTLRAYNTAGSLLWEHPIAVDALR
jgi:alkaline phosphatase D